jgi:hypothetical protein
MTLSYNATGAVKIYNATNSRARFKDKNYFSYCPNALAYNTQRFRCSVVVCETLVRSWERILSKDEKRSFFLNF